MMHVQHTLRFLAVCVMAAAAHAPIVNGYFDELSRDPNCPEGWACDGNVWLIDSGDNGFTLLLREPAPGAVSRIYQEVDGFCDPNDPNEDVLSFGYRLYSTGSGSTSASTAPGGGISHFFPQSPILDPQPFSRRVVVAEGKHLRPPRANSITRSPFSVMSTTVPA